MSDATVATLIFGAILVGVALFFSLAGRLSFWKLASKIPNEALEHFEREYAWVFANNSERPTGWSGPYYLPVPDIGCTVELYANPEKIEEYQSRFMEQYRDRVPDKGFPFISFIALIYPVVALLSLSEMPITVIGVLSYGFANLGCLLLVAGVFFWSVPSICTRRPGHHNHCRSCVLGCRRCAHECRIATACKGRIFRCAFGSATSVLLMHCVSRHN
ncbi:hypothetical protein [Algiphilus sp.]|uniref:hypothetical protein n=1 Tax=Algiphilus sp. TaxID=1872431 RepID=UPI0032ED8346